MLWALLVISSGVIRPDKILNQLMGYLWVNIIIEKDRA
jgi:hypothetical protein